MEEGYYVEWLTEREDLGKLESWTEEEKEQLFQSYLRLHCFIEAGDKKAVLQHIKDKNIEPDTYKIIAAQFTLPMSPVAAAARSGKVEIMKTLISLGFSTNDKCVNLVWDWRRPLHLAASENQTEAVRSLVEDYNVEIDCKDSEEVTPLVWTMLLKENTQTAKYLVEAGASVNNPCGKNNNTPLLFAAHHNRVDIGKYLISKGANVNARSSSRHTPFTVAIKRSASVHLVSAMLDAGAKVNMADGDGNRPLHLAIGSADEDDLDMDLFKLLISRGADVNAVDSNYDTPLHLATELEFSELAWYLLVDMNAAMTAENSSEWTPFTVAFEHRQAEIIELLLGCGFDPGQEDCVNGYDRGIEDDSEEWETLVAKLQQIGSNPLPLKKMCIGEIRSILGSGPGFKADLEELGLPCSIMTDIFLK